MGKQMNKKNAPETEEAKKVENTGRKNPSGRNMDKRGSGNTSGGHKNDPTWHVLNAEILRDFGRLNFNTPLGYSVDFSDGLKDGKYVCPGLMNIVFAPNLGCSENAASGIALAANQLYSFVRHANSGSANYNAPDLMMYVGAMDSIYMLYWWLVRAYGVARTYSQRNRYLPRAYFQAMNINFDDFMANISQFKGWLDFMSSAINQRSVPSTLDIFKYHAHRVSYIYTDGATAKSQQYIYNPAYVYRYDAYTDRRGGKLTPVYLSSVGDGSATVAPWTVSALQNLLTELLNNVITDEDTGIMWGDLLKAFGSENMLAIPTVAWDYTIAAEYNVTELATINNTVLAGMPGTWTIGDKVYGFSIFQDPSGSNTEGGDILFRPATFTQAALPADAPRLCNSRVEDPSPEDLVEWLRGTTQPAAWYSGQTWGTDSKGLVATYSSVPTVLPLYAEVISLMADGSGFSSAVVTSVMSKTADVLTARVTQFDWHPIIYVVDKSATLTFATPEEYFTGTSLVGILGDLDLYTLLPRHYLKMYHDTSVLSELNVYA